MNSIKRELNLFRRMYNLMMDCSKHNISVYAGQSTLFLIMSAFPFLMVLLALSKYFIPFSAADVVGEISNYLPFVRKSTIENIVYEIFIHKDMSVMSFTAVLLIWSSSKGVMSLMLGLDSVYEIKSDRNWLVKRIIAFLYTIAFVVSLLLTLILLVLGNSITKAIGYKFPSIEKIIKSFDFLKYAAPSVILTLIFWSGYKFLPTGKTFHRICLPGALTTTICWVGFSYLFGVYVTYFSNYSYIYGSLTFVVLLMLWLYVCTNFFLVGAEINAIMQRRREKKVYY